MRCTLALVGLLGLIASAHARPQVSVFRAGKPQTSPRSSISVATFNVENLHAYRPRPASWTSKEPERLPRSEREYRRKVHRLASTIVTQLHCPDIIALQEVETPPARWRGREDALRDLAVEVSRLSAARGRPARYSFARPEGTPDERGIGQAFLIADRVRLASGTTTDLLLSAKGQLMNPRPLNATASTAARRDDGGSLLFRRPLLAAAFEVFRDGPGAGPAETIYVLNNHFKANPSMYRERRLQQARFNASLVTRLLRQDPRAKIVVAGDFNLDFNVHRDQIAPLRDAQRGGRRLLESLAEKLPAGRFSHCFEGRGCLLDGLLASQAFARALVEVRIPHVNSVRRPGRRGSDHDPVLARFAAFGPL
jgi:predicted extracellular nuclease